jgi:hypothetical protein
VELQQPYSTPLVPEYDQVLPQDAEPHRQVLEHIRPDDRMPEPAQVFSARRAGPNMGELFIFLRDFTVEIPTVRGAQKG